jgi:transcriptional regulatory protein LevR
MLFLKRKGDEQITAAVRYIPPDVADVPRFKEDRTISGEVLHELAALLAPDRIAARAERQVSLGTMKAG